MADHEPRDRDQTSTVPDRHRTSTVNLRKAADQEEANPPGTSPGQPRPASSQVNPGHERSDANWACGNKTSGSVSQPYRAAAANASVDAAKGAGGAANVATDAGAGDYAGTGVRDTASGEPKSEAKEGVMKQLKWEVADQLGLADDLQDPDELSVREAGKVGGNMVRRLIERGKQAMAKEQGEDNLPPPHR